jgi:hypothetical protein
MVLVRIIACATRKVAIKRKKCEFIGNFEEDSKVLGAFKDGTF